MPANLTPQYHRAEAEYRRAGTPEQELACLSAMLRELPKHKGTDRLQGELKQKISRLRKELEAGAQLSRKGPGWRISRQGAGRVVLIGAPNVGKSQLLAALTRATPDIAAYPFTTREPALGMMVWQDVAVQIVDTPAITADFLDPQLQGLIRGSDLVLLVIDTGSDDGLMQADEVLKRLSTTKTRLSSTSFLDDQDIGRSYTQTFLVFNKIDLDQSAARQSLFQQLFPQIDLRQFPISALARLGLVSLQQGIVDALDVVRVFTKSPQERQAAQVRPYIVKRGSLLAEVAELIHHDLARELKYARVWNADGQGPIVAKADYVVHDYDTIEIHT